MEDEQVSIWPRNEIIRGEAIQSRGSEIRREVANRLKNNNIESQSVIQCVQSVERLFRHLSRLCGQETHICSPEAFATENLSQQLNTGTLTRMARPTFLVAFDVPSDVSRLYDLPPQTTCDLVKQKHFFAGRCSHGRGFGTGISPRSGIASTPTFSTNLRDSEYNVGCANTLQFTNNPELQFPTASS